MKVMVAGAWDESDEKILDVAVKLGEELSRRGIIVITGGGKGTPYAVNRGVQNEKGLSIAYISTSKESDLDHEENSIVTGSIYTEMGWDGRSVLAVKNSDVLIVLGGANGTLNEITLAYLNKIPIYILKNSSELITRLEGMLIEKKFIDKRKNVPICFFENIDILLDVLIRLKEKKNE